MNTESKLKTPFWVLGKSGAYAVLIVGLAATLLPFFYIMVSSLKTDAELRKTPPDFFPQQPTLKHYTTILTDQKIPIERNVANSVIVSLARVFITLFTSSFAGFIFAKYHFRGKNLAFGVILLQIMIPFQVIMIPNYLLVVRFGLINSLWALDPPVHGGCIRYIHDEAVHQVDACRADGCGSHRRRIGIRHLFSYHSAPNGSTSCPPLVSLPSCSHGTTISGP